MHTSDLRWQRASTLLSREAWPPLWPAVLVALAVIGLLLAFRQVVAQAVVQGDLRRTAEAARHDAIWRCKLQHDRLERAQCLMRVPGAADVVLPQGEAAQTASASGEPDERNAAVARQARFQPMEK